MTVFIHSRIDKTGSSWLFEVFSSSRSRSYVNSLEEEIGF